MLAQKKLMANPPLDSNRAKKQLQQFFCQLESFTLSMTDGRGAWFWLRLWPHVCLMQYHFNLFLENELSYQLISSLTFCNEVTLEGIRKVQRKGILQKYNTGKYLSSRICWFILNFNCQVIQSLDFSLMLTEESLVLI